MNFKSVYAIRLYEILLSDFKASFFSRHKFEYSIERLRQLVGCEDKLLKFSQFKDKCLCKAIIEINKSDTSEFTLTAKYHKNGRAVEGVSFILLGRSECFLPCDDYYDIITTSTEWNESWAEPDTPI